VKNRAILAVDIGGSKYMTGLIRPDGTIIAQERRTWTAYTQPLIRAQLMQAISDMLLAHSDVEIAGGGATIPGLADPESGIWRSTEFMGIKDYAIATDFEREFSIPFFIENDGRACVLAERYFGAGQGCDNFLYITVSNGVGGGLFLNGRLHAGAFGNAGEIGQVVVVENGRLSDDGTAGTLEMYAATAGLVQNYIEAGGDRSEPGAGLNGKHIAALARAGYAPATEAFRLEGYYLGKAIAAVHNVLDLEKVILGGGLSLAFDLFKPSLVETVRTQTYKRTYESPEIAVTPLGYTGALFGAAALVLNR
jgi:glucokinase